MLHDQIQKDLLSGIDLDQFEYLKSVLKTKEKIFKKEIVDSYIKNYKVRVEFQESTIYVDPIPGTNLS